MLNKVEHGRDEHLEAANVEMMANELDRLLEKYKDILEWEDRLNAADILRKDYGTKLRAMDKMFADVVPKYAALMRDSDIITLAHRFMDFCDRYNKGELGGVPLDLRRFPEPSLNEVRLLVRKILQKAMKDKG
jgi:uncharacterized protein YqgQ